MFDKKVQAEALILDDEGSGHVVDTDSQAHPNRVGQRRRRGGNRRNVALTRI